MSKYKVSVIIPIYNVEDYLEESIQSVISQTIGFENIELILVNDGSPDNSGAICEKYEKLYPDNVVYINQKNAGVSAARNNGLKAARGEFINFLDADDKFEPDTFATAVKLFKKYPEISSVFYKLKFFDAKKGEHPINNYYRGKKLIDLFEDYECIKLQCCSLMFKGKDVKDYAFFSGLKISEDARFLTEFFLDHPKAYISNCNYLYRIRQNETSAIQTSKKKKTWYLDTPKECFNYICDLSKEKYGEVKKFIQYFLAYDMRWRLRNEANLILTPEENKEYISLICRAMKNVDDQIIADFPTGYAEKTYLLNLKYEGSDMYSIDEENLLVNNTILCPKDSFHVLFDNIIIHGDEISIYGRMPKIKNVIENAVLRDNNNNDYKFEFYNLDRNTKYPLKMCNELNLNYIGIKTKINLKGIKTLTLIGKIKKEEYPIKLTFSYNSILNNKFQRIYLRTDNYLIKHRNGKLVISSNNILNKAINELGINASLLLHKRFASLAYRICANIHRIFNHKKIWIVSDRIQVAGDNGEAFFDYLYNNPQKGVKLYFDIGKNAPDYKRFVEKYGRKYILAHKSFKHKINFLNADKIISAQADNYVYNLFGTGKNYLGDLYRFHYIFLQHGIIKDDLSPWLSVNSKKMDIFITSAEPEYKSIVKTYPYNFPDGTISLTGLARYDKLMKKDTKLKNQIVIMPTWRTSLTTNIDLKTGLREHNDEFKKTEYFQFYNTLINDERLINTLKEYGYTIKFMPHQNMLAQIDDFDKNDYVMFNQGIADYTKEFKENKLLVTDFSSVFFDFAYLNKPVIYAQFDRETFWKGQIYDEGYFDYDKMSFGPITFTVKETVDRIINYVKNDCVLEDKYQKRIAKFYKYRDQKNCERTLDIIKKLK